MPSNAPRDRGDASHSTDDHLPVAEVSMVRDVKSVLCCRMCRTSWLASSLAPRTPNVRSTGASRTAAATTLSFFCPLTRQLAPLLFAWASARPLICDTLRVRAPSRRPPIPLASERSSFSTIAAVSQRPRRLGGVIVTRRRPCQLHPLAMRL